MVLVNNFLTLLLVIVDGEVVLVIVDGEVVLVIDDGEVVLGLHSKLTKLTLRLNRLTSEAQLVMSHDLSMQCTTLYSGTGSYNILNTSSIISYNTKSENMN